MSIRIFKKEESGHISVDPAEFVEIGSSTGSGPGEMPLVLPEVGGLNALPSQPAGTSSSAPNSNPLQDLHSQASSIIADAEARGKEIEDSAMETAMMTFEEKVNVAINVATNELREQFAETLESFTELKSDLAERIERDLVGLALAVAKKVIGREIEMDRTIVIELLNNGLAKLQERSLAEVHLNPEDISYIEEHRSEIVFRGTLDLRPDSSISPGGCLIHTETGDIDARIKSQFDEIYHGLLEE